MLNLILDVFMLHSAQTANGDPKKGRWCNSAPSRQTAGTTDTVTE